MKKITSKKVDEEFFISQNAFKDLLISFGNIVANDQLVGFKKSKALKLILESDKKDNLGKKQKFIEKIFGKAKNDSKVSFAAQSAILMDILYLAVINNKLDKKYESFVNKLDKRLNANDTKLHPATELDLIAAVNKIYSL